MQYRKLQTKFGKKLLSGLSLCLCTFLLWGANVNAAEKETPLVNLAEGVTAVKDSNGNKLTNVELLTDEDKYYLQHSANGNKVDGSVVAGHQNNNGWEAYVEQGAQVGSEAKWIQMDLGASYPLEVINLKRRVYDGVGSTTTTSGLGGSALKYTDTVIVIGNKADLSDGYVVYYNDDDGSVELPQGVTKPNNVATGGLNEQMAGTYFYMDNMNENGTGYTKLGTTKTARYIRVYSDDPDEDEDLMFMELAVYGYRSADKIQGTRAKKVINNEQPLMIAAAYSDDQWYLGQEAGVGLQGYNTIAGRWNTVADDLKDNTVLMMHSNNLRSFSPHYIGQAYIHGYYEACLEEAYQAGASTMLMLVNASSYPGGTTWCITRDTDYHWVDLMFRMYPNLESVFSTENFWSGSIGGVANSIAKFLEIVNRYGGYLVYSEEGTGVFNTLANQTALREAVEKYGDSLYYTYKNTAGGNDCLLTQSHIMGSWLAGYTGGWGMLSDSWAWGNNGQGHYYEGRGGAQGWQALCAEPETIFGMQMLNTYLSGGVVYTFEFPEVVYGAIDEKSPAYTHVVERVFRYICENPGPSREDILNDTKVILYNAVPQSLYSQTVGADNVLGLFQTGRYGAIPSIPTWGSQTEVTRKLKETAKKEGASAPIVLSNGDGLLGYGGKDYFKSLYPTLEYLGDAFANQYDGRWHIYNNTLNKKVNQDAILPLEAAEGTARFKATVEPHTYVILKEKDNGSMDISLNNYRVNAKEIIFNNKYGWDWSGSSATGQGVSPAKLSVYRYMAYYNVVNAKKGVLNLDTPNDLTDTIDQLSPNDNELRATTFELTSLTEKPTVTVKAGQKPDTDGLVQYKEPVVIYDTTSKTATITVECNGWIELEVTNLQFEVDEDAIKIEEKVEEPEEPEEPEVPEEPQTTNVAAGKEVTGSHETNTNRPYTKVTDETITCGDYDFADFKDNHAVWAQIDLGSLHEIEEVQMWRYFRDSRQYKDTVIMLSEDETFPAGETLVIWNSNDDADVKWLNEQGSTQKHGLPVGSDPLYNETDAGKAFKVYGNNVKWLDETTDGVPTEKNNTFVARYVRVYMNGSSSGQTNHLIEVKVMGEPYTPPTIDSYNVAENKAVTGSHVSNNMPYNRVTNGVTTCGDADYANFGDVNEAVWAQIDLGDLHEIEEVQMWRYFRDTRQYKDTVIMLSEDASFRENKTLVIWNSNNDTDAKWPNTQGSTEKHGLPKGADALYTETSEGKAFKVYGDNVKWLNGTTDGVPTEKNNTFVARYVRVYMNGSSAGLSNHLIEVKVMGIPYVENYGENCNLAKDMTATGSHAVGSDRAYSKIVDEVTTCGDGDYTNFGDVNEAVWAQIDLGEVQKVEKVQMWRYNRDSRQYKDTVILLSEDATFPEDETLVIWNSNDDTEAKWLNAQGSSQKHGLPIGSDALYNEATTGKEFTVYGQNVKWLDGTTAGVPTADEGNNRFKARYVRVYMNGSSAGASNHLIEVKVFGEPKIETEIPGIPEVTYDTNLATRAGTSVSTATSSDRPASKAIDGVKDINQYTDPGGNDGGAQWIQLDLGIKHQVNNVALWRYTGRPYYNTVVMLSPDKNFAPDTTLVLWNGNGANGGKNGAAVTSWPGEGNGSTGTHTVPEGTDPHYNETADGKVFKVTDSSVKWLNGSTDNLPDGLFDARYVRIYMNGNSSNTSNHVVEIEVYGIEGDFVLEDTEAPEQVAGIEAVERYATSAVISFLPSMDNMGLKGYKLSVGKQGETASVIELNQTMYELTGLEPNTTYEVSIIAVDNYNNESVVSDTYTFTTRNENDFVVTANVTSGKYEEAQRVTLSVPANEGEIYYTLDGTEPFDANGNPKGTAVKYTSGEVISIAESSTLHAALKLYNKVWATSAYFYQIGADMEMDFAAPEAPAEVTVVETAATEATISWSGSDADIRTFNVYVNGEKKAEVNITRSVMMQTTITDLTPQTAYQVYITAVDVAGNESIRSKTVELVTRVQ